MVLQLTPAQLDQLQPVSMKPNAYGVTKYYNRCDVEVRLFLGAWWILELSLIEPEITTGG
jgi:hypothetical protein